MPSPNAVDLTAVLPALKQAVEPFLVAQNQAEQARVSPTSQVRSFVPLANTRLLDMWRLVDAVQAVRRIAGDVK